MADQAGLIGVCWVCVLCVWGGGGVVGLCNWFDWGCVVSVCRSVLGCSSCPSASSDLLSVKFWSSSLLTFSGSSLLLLSSPSQLFVPFFLPSLSPPLLLLYSISTPICFRFLLSSLSQFSTPFCFLFLLSHSPLSFLHSFLSCFPCLPADHSLSPPCLLSRLRVLGCWVGCSASVVMLVLWGGLGCKSCGVFGCLLALCVGSVEKTEQNTTKTNIDSSLFCFVEVLGMLQF
eukprot:Lithocolla_globosa_v1_NODE_369_length_4280_cov_26.823000.p2 type:complete len:231 gc:universal NODE_369_length_4280_cov_26.823000:3902-3210(-)